VRTVPGDERGGRDGDVYAGLRGEQPIVIGAVHARNYPADTELLGEPGDDQVRWIVAGRGYQYIGVSRLRLGQHPRVSSIAEHDTENVFPAWDVLRSTLDHGDVVDLREHTRHVHSGSACPADQNPHQGLTMSATSSRERART